ncbi:MAG: hypothetical protein HY002_11290 [Candidatus Rokubacteria bacterium]|nr:hypothetical protein [Candidatus Rokubacteria bacterium]
MTNGAGSDIVGHFRTGLDVIKRYPVMAAPPLAAQLVMFVLTLLFVVTAGAGVVVGGIAGGLFAGGLAFMLVTLIGGILTLVASGVTIVMARDALARREPSMGEALGTVMDRLADVLVASILVMVIVGIGMVLLVIPGIVAAIFLMFALPAVLLDGTGAVDALKRSTTLVKDNLGPVVGLIVGWIVAVIVVMIIAQILRFMPLVGRLASALLFGVFIAYLTVVVVSVYQTLPRR